MALIRKHVVTKGLGDINCLIGGDSRGVAAIIDRRGANVAGFMQYARKHKVAITHIVLTISLSAP